MTRKKTQKVCVSKKRTINTYAMLWWCSRGLLLYEQAEQKKPYWLWMGSLIFTAFSFEAYLNHIGKILFTCWNRLERLSPDSKLDIVCEKLGILLPIGERPRQTIKGLFKFRNELAHGKTNIIEPDDTILDGDQYTGDLIEDFPETKWEKYCNISNAERAREDIEKVMQLIHEKVSAVTNEIDPLWFSGLIEILASPHRES